MNQILIIEDDQVTRENMVLLLGFHGYRTLSAEKGCKGIELLKQEEIALILLDLNLPDCDGRDVITEIRKFNNDVRIIVVTGRRELTEMPIVLQMGADDFIAKPWTMDTLYSKVEVVLRHKRMNFPFFRSGNFNMDFNARTVQVNNEMVFFTKIEYEILEILAMQAGSVIEYKELFDYFAKENYSEDKYNLKSIINKIKKN
ncbi:MAG: ompR [Ignavibacteria bacterium]|nr:ompR [Ignavibacteria bacterium]